MDDSALAIRAAKGDEGAFELLVRRHTENVWRLARSLLRNDAEAEDAVQETFIKAYRAMDSFRGDSAFGTWLHSICYRTCLDRIRGRRAEVVPLGRVRERRGEEESLEVRMAVEEIIRSLPEEERRAFVLVHVLGYSREEAARICDVPSSTIRSRVSRARERLAGLLDEAAAEEDG